MLVVKVVAGRERLVMGLLNLVQGDGGKANGGIGSRLLVQDLDIESGVIVLDFTELKCLLP
jgi:hypothetical protein